MASLQRLTGSGPWEVAEVRAVDIDLETARAVRRRIV
jgi:hypothetical protein